MHKVWTQLDLRITYEMQNMQNDAAYLYRCSLFPPNESVLNKIAQAASEIKPVLQSARINEYNYKTSSMGQNPHARASNLKRKPNKSWWPLYTYPRSAGWERFAQYLETTPKISEQREKFLNTKIMSPLFSPKYNRDKDVNSQMDIVKITTIIETIRRKRQRSVQPLEQTNNIQRIIRRKRSKRSSHESRNNPKIIESSWHSGKTFDSKRRFPYLRHYQDRRKAFPRKNRAADRDPKAAHNIAIPSTVFYKRIWEYINGTRPHSDIISGYNPLGGKSGEDNSTCVDEERISASQSRENGLQTITPKPEREFYKRIWDIINATRTYENARARSKRNANTLEDQVASAAAASDQPCAQGRETGEEENKRTTKERTARHGRLDTYDTTIPPREESNPGVYVSGFWKVANKTQWQPKTVIPVVNIAKLNDDPSRANIGSASEVTDLNKSPQEVPDKIDSSRNSTERVEEAPTDDSLGITEPGPPYLSQGENVTASSSKLTELSGVNDDASRENGPTRHLERYSTDNPVYDPSNIPYVEVPDYSDQREDSLDRNNRSSAAGEYKEYDDGDYIDAERSYNDDGTSTKSPSAEIKSLPNIQSENGNEEESSLNADVPRCAENDNTAECADNYDVEESHDNTESHGEDDTSGDVHQPTEESTDAALSAERENVTADFPPIHFDINEYRKPFNLDDFIKNDAFFKSIRAAADKEDARQDDKQNSDGNDESEEYETYATYPQEQSYDHLAKNKDRYANDFVAISNDRDGAQKNTDSYAKEEAKDSEVINEDHYPYDDKDFFQRIFGEENDKESSETADTENDFLSRYFTEDVLRQMRDNSTTEEDRKREESRNRENVHKTLSKILDKKDHFSRLNDDIDKMIEKGEAVPIKYNNFWSLEYESPRKKVTAKEEEEKEEEDEEN